MNVALLKLGVVPERRIVALQSAPYEHFAERRTLSDLASAKRTMLVPMNALVLPSIQTSEMTKLWGIVVNEAMAASNQAVTSYTSAAMAASFRLAAVLASGSKSVGPEDM